ncbi:MAG: hypothetical protein Q8P55_00590 [bacterium]|nr:hypothetical protein [bacterium]
MANSLNRFEEEIGTAVFDSGRVSFGEVLWHVHRAHPELELPPAPIFIDLGALPPELVIKIGENLHRKAVQENIRFERVAGVPTGGNGFAEAFCMVDQGNTSRLLTLQKEGQRILGPVQGFYQPHNIVLPVEDVITTGASTLEAIEVFGAENCIVHDVMAVIDYELGAAQRLKTDDLTLHRIFPISQLLGLWLEKKRITMGQYDKVMAVLNTIRTKLMPSS